MITLKITIKEENDFVVFAASNPTGLEEASENEILNAQLLEKYLRMMGDEVMELSAKKGLIAKMISGTGSESGINKMVDDMN